MKPLTVLVLAGGSGTRFWPFQGDKLLWQFGKKKLFEQTILQSLPPNVEQIVVVTNERNETDIQHISFPAPVFFVRQSVATGMADAILTAKQYINGTQLLILIADDYFDRNLPSQIIETAHRTNAFAVIPGWKTKTYFPGGYMVVEGNKIKRIIEKPGMGNEPSPYVNISGHFIADGSKLLQVLETTVSANDDVYETALSQLMQKEEFIVHEYDGPFTSLKYPWHVLSMMDMFLDELQEYRGSDVMIKPNVIIEGPVYLGNNVKIMEFTKIVGPVYIGDNTIVGNNNVIRHSMIGDNCVTGFSSDITRSYIGNGCWFHTNYVGDSVLEHNISMGSGTVFANLRLDEGEIVSMIKGNSIATGRNKLGAMIGSNVRIGVNTSTMPGIKIGSNSSIGAGLIIGQDIPDDSFVKSTTQLSIRKSTSSIGQNREAFKNKI